MTAFLDIRIRQVYFRCAMKRAGNISLRIFVTAAFVLGSLGIPLYQHVCSTMKTRSFAGSCAMHHKPEHRKACCMAEEASSADVSPNAVSQGGPGSSSCCAQVEVTKTINDAYTYSDSKYSVIMSATDAPAAEDAAAYAQCLIAKIHSLFSDSSPPFSRTKYILHEIFLI
jgi:hypothetical protein